VTGFRQAYAEDRTYMYPDKRILRHKVRNKATEEKPIIVFGPILQNSEDKHEDKRIKAENTENYVFICRANICLAFSNKYQIVKSLQKISTEMYCGVFSINCTQ
jgi:hypothetical protein